MIGYKVKTHKSITTICRNLEFTREVDIEFLKSASRFEIMANIQRTDGIFERITFENINPVEIDLCSDWSFNINAPPVLIDKLITF